MADNTNLAAAKKRMILAIIFTGIGFFVQCAGFIIAGLGLETLVPVGAAVAAVGTIILIVSLIIMIIRISKVKKLSKQAETKAE